MALLEPFPGTPSMIGCSMSGSDRTAEHSAQACHPYAIAPNLVPFEFKGRRPDGICGTKMAGPKHFTGATDTQVYFQDPTYTWQRGSIKNMNGLLRRVLTERHRSVVCSQAKVIASRRSERPGRTPNSDTSAKRGQRNKMSCRRDRKWLNWRECSGLRTLADALTGGLIM